MLFMLSIVNGLGDFFLVVFLSLIHKLKLFSFQEMRDQKETGFQV